MGQVTAGPIFVDGHRLWDINSTVLSERRRLARDGVVTVVVTVDKETGEVLKDPELASSGFVELDESQELFEKTSNMVLSALDREGSHILESEGLRTRITQSVSDFLHGETRRRPTVLTIIDQV